jgi:prolyl-tRNA editing enzyme YbaK/EbsC (Cys-tRNA(Pro) deacylase)
MAKEKDIYLVGFYSMKPRKGVKTTVKGWMNDQANLQYDEKVEITRGIKNSAMTAKIVLNLSKKTVERNGFNADRDFKSLFKYFFGGYHQYITEVMKQLDPEYLADVLDELQAEMEAEQAAQAATVKEIYATATAGPEPKPQDPTPALMGY